MKKIIYWLPRILSIFFIVFISIFAFDVFGTSQWFQALLIHLIPSFVLIILTMIAWKYEKLGSLLFFITSIFFFSYFKSLIFFTPLFIISILFFIKPKIN